jgi:hypothetical protein
MNAREIFENSVKAMKLLVTRDEMMASIMRAKERGEEGNVGLLAKEREGVNELVRKVVGNGGSKDALEGAPQELIDALVLRYIANRDVFMKTFPDGIEDIDPDPFAIWASIMISPRDEPPAR